MDIELGDQLFQDLAKSLVHNCFRNSSTLEYVHSGVFPDSKTGDYSDVKVVSPYGEIPWTGLGRISDKEMYALNKEVVNRVYTYLKFIFSSDHPGYILSYPSRWDGCEIDQDLQTKINWVIKTLDDRKTAQETPRG